MGFARGRAAEMAQALVSLSGDMASFNNRSIEDTLIAIRSGLAGQTEPLRQFGVFLSQTRIQQEALSLGLVEGKQKLSDAHKAAAVYSIVLKDTKDAQGDAAKTGDQLAGLDRRLSAIWADVTAAFGKGLIPAVERAGAKLVGFLGAESTIARAEHFGQLIGHRLPDAIDVMVGFFQRAGPPILQFLQGAVKFGQAFAGRLIVIGRLAAKVASIVGGWEASMKLLTGGALALKAGQFAGSLFLIGKTAKTAGTLMKAAFAGTIVGAIVLAATLIISNWDKVKLFFRATVEFMKTAWRGLADVLIGTMKFAGGKIIENYTFVQREIIGIFGGLFKEDRYRHRERARDEGFDRHQGPHRQRPGADGARRRKDRRGVEQQPRSRDQRRHDRTVHRVRQHGTQ